MPNFHAGDELVETFKLITPNNDAITGAVQGVDLTIDVSLDPAGASFAADVVISEIGSGWYKVAYQSLTTALAGHYLVGIVYTGANPRSFEIEWDVEADQVTTPTTVASIVVGPTLQEIRRGVLGLLGDITILTATANTTSSLFEDLDNIVQGGGNYAARELYVTGGTVANVGQRRRVSGSSAQGQITLARALPANVATGDEAELINTFGTGIRFEDVMNAIRHSIDVARPTVPITAEITGTFDPTSRAIAIPDDFYAIDSIESRWSQYSLDSWTSVSRSDTQGDYGYWVDRANRVIYIGDYAGYELRGKVLRIYGLALVTAPVNDSDVVPVNREWLVYRTAADLALRPLHLGGQASGSDLQSMGMLWEDRANKMRDRIRSRPRAGRTILS